MRQGRGAIGRGVATLAGVALLAMGLSACEDSLRGPTSPSGAGGGPYGYLPPPPPPPPAQPSGPAFNAGEFAWSVGQGPGSLVGRVAYHAVSGERWTCAGQTIALAPATRYSAARMRALYGSDQRAVTPKVAVQSRNAASPGVDYGAYVRTASCSLHDGFSFAHLPTGPYFLIAAAHPKGRAPGPSDGVVILQRVDVAPGPTRIVAPQP